MPVQSPTVPKSVINRVLPICKFFAITPWNTYKDEKDDDCIKSRFYQVYAVLVMLACLVSLVSGVYNSTLDYPTYSLHHIVVIIDHIMFVSITTANILGTFMTVFYKGDVIKEYAERIISINKFIPIRGCPKSYWRMVIIFCIIVCFTIFLDTAVWIYIIGWKFYKYYIFREFQYFHYSVMVFLAYYFACMIRCKFASLNVLLTEDACQLSSQEKYTHDFLPVYDMERLLMVNNDEKTTQQNLKDVFKWYTEIADILEIYNSIFGQIIFIASMCTIALLLNYIVYFLISPFTIAILILVMFWILIALVQIITLAYVCDSVAKEAKKTPEICYILLNKIPTIPKTDKDKILREELQLIAQQAICRNPCISASGFFVVNNSILGFIMASVTSYIIVTIQFVGQH
ncbi:unnamed protein product [Brassicogethes aeneus]|uniref:Gustatory receptor n=1 Tax=Brassicogethes aeneus TaxID=1431903 RepID=A0A9P0FS74_BRAAE|nr:unnamed protein product [Brassicogethes aeneus]